MKSLQLYIRDNGRNEGRPRRGTQGGGVCVCVCMCVCVLRNVRPAIFREKRKIEHYPPDPELKIPFEKKKRRKCQELPKNNTHFRLFLIFNFFKEFNGGVQGLIFEFFQGVSVFGVLDPCSWPDVSQCVCGVCVCVCVCLCVSLLCPTHHHVVAFEA